MTEAVTPETLEFDIVIIGGGPAGLSFARLLKSTGLSVAVIERQSEADIANPKEDGRDIALTHTSRTILEEMGVWARMAENEIGFIREARVLNGTSDYSLVFDSAPARKEFLGNIIGNHVIRKAVYDEAKQSGCMTLLDNAAVASLRIEDNRAVIALKDGRRIMAKLAIGADSRFSEARRQMGISTSMYDFGRSVIVSRVAHDRPHENVAYECFKYGMTLAILPMVGNVSSTVITVPSDTAAEMMRMPEPEYAAMMQDAFDGKLGDMRMDTPRHLYPLVATYATRFYAERFALVGDAAVGMHPVTAHGYNFGLVGADILAREIAKAVSLGLDFAAADVLEKYNTAHRRATRPLYLGTNAIVKLFTTDTPLARVARGGLLHLGNMLSPLNRVITSQLTNVRKRA